MPILYKITDGYNANMFLCGSLHFKMPVLIDIGSMTLANNRVRFNGRGLPPDVASNENISVMNQRGARTLTLNRLGHMELN